MEKWTLKKWDSPDYLDGIRTDLMIEKGKYEPVAYAFEEDQARLIAAAPELLEALDQLAGNAEIARFMIVDEDGVVSSALWDTIQQARAAIAKATQP